MNAVSVYVNTAKLVLQSTETTTVASSSINPELSGLLFHLRQLLSCVVCNQLVNDPYAPQSANCSHNVCRLCVRGRKILHPVCSYCKDNKDFKTYNENKQMRCLLMCYKSLCEHLRCSSLFGNFAALKVGHYNTALSSVIIPKMSLQELIIEGANYDDIINTFNSDVPKLLIKPIGKHTQMSGLITPLTSIAAATPLVPMQNPIKATGMQQSAPKASPPPATVSKPISTRCPKLIQNSSQNHYKNHSSIAAATVSLPNNPTSQEHQTTISATGNHTQLIQLNQLKNSGNITYIGPNTRGIVVPIVSSSGSTAVPLSIASARLQTLNRQLAQARATAISSTTTAPTTSVNTTTNSIENRSVLTTLKGTTSSSHIMKSVATFSSAPSITSTTSCVTVPSQLRNPPPIKTVSNGSAMYSVLYTGIGNKITIKRKTDADDDTTQKKNSMSTQSSNILRPLSKTPNKKRGCRCGNTTATPGKLTCCGQRCPCYVDSKSCIGCKCRGCRNPHRPDGNKVRPIIPELACYEIQMADDIGNINELPIATTSNAINVQNNDNNTTKNLTTPLHLSASTSASAVSVIASTSTNTTLIPLRNLQHFTTPSVSSSSCVTTSTTIPPLTSTTMPAQTSSMTLASFGTTSTSSTPVSVVSSMSSNVAAPGNIVQLDQIQRESLLIQNSEGKFQVVNVFTTGASNCSGQSSNQIPTLQRIKTIPQTIVSAHNSFVLPTSLNSTTITGTTTTTSLPQLILQSHQQSQQHQPTQHLIQYQQQQQQQQQQQLNHQSLSTQRIPNINTNSLPLQLQQQLKQNIITVHAIHTNPTSNTSPVTAPVLTPSSSPAPTSATISLTPLITNNSHSGLELSDSSEVSRNAYTNIIVSSSSSSVNTASSTSPITSIPLTVSLTGNVHTQSLNRKTLNSPNF